MACLLHIACKSADITLCLLSIQERLTGTQGEQTLYTFGLFSGQQTACVGREMPKHEPKQAAPAAVAHLLGPLLFLGSRQQQVCKIVLVQLQHVAAHSKGVFARVPIQNVEQLGDASWSQTCQGSSKMSGA